MNQQIDNQWYLIEDINTIDSPTIVVYPDRVKSKHQLRS